MSDTTSLLDPGLKIIQLTNALDCANELLVKSELKVKALEKMINTGLPHEENLRIWNEMLGYVVIDKYGQIISIRKEFLRKHWHKATGWLPPER